MLCPKDKIAHMHGQHSGCESNTKLVVFFSHLQQHSNCVFWRGMDCIHQRGACPASRSSLITLIRDRS